MRFEAYVTPGDPDDRRKSEEAHAVYVKDGESGARKFIGVWPMKHQAEDIAAVINKWAGRQIR